MFIVNQMFKLSTQHSSIMFEITNVSAIILMKQNDEETDREIREN
jgi:hypothetical protein